MAIKTNNRRGGYSNRIVGIFKKKLYGYMAWQYKFDKWHTMPINFRPYAISIVDYLNAQQKYSVVEIGCGLGEIVGNIHNCNKEGYDIDPHVICAAKKLFTKTKFGVGTFEDIKNKRIDYLITVNFIHNIAPNELKKQYELLCEHNNIEHFVLDIVHDKSYQFNHSIEFLFDKSAYRIEKRLGRWITAHGYRCVYILKKL